MKVTDVPILTEAVVALGIGAFAVAFIPFRRVARTVQSAGGRPAVSRDEILPVRRAVRRAARNVPWRALCFEQGLAVQAMLRRRGLSCVLHYGIAREPTPGRGLQAHVWVTSGGHMVIGEEAAPRFVELARFPAKDQAATCDST
ncbi:lasso peptide biosynthesis B2 protein [Brevundimonas sp. A19_0]|uniref:lasso peptide biosynthesis B2 protein n=1 Tax=Brevundimonas sp. A19_0 TaxID=2821087 RepID=UPI001ADC09C2|nr:lasso peptide biosynthesis B2 protein [Brevundimonas sp. A19_0]MBO9500676.1 lasso peptide biosynthesis B2 protein [Brevundimonas sp. A19_0]